MTLEYAEIIHDLVEKNIDLEYPLLLLGRSDRRQVYELVERLKNEKREYDYISDTCKDPTIKEVSLAPICDRIFEIIKAIEEL